MTVNIIRRIAPHFHFSITFNLSSLLRFLFSVFLTHQVTTMLISGATIKLTEENNNDTSELYSLLSSNISQGSKLNHGRSYSDEIMFPDTILLNNKRPDELNNEQVENDKLTGSTCVTMDGKLGVCQTRRACETASHFQLLQTHRVAICGYHNDNQLICCPRRRLNPHMITSTKPELTPNPNKPSSISGLTQNNYTSQNQNNTNSQSQSSPGPPAKATNIFGQSTNSPQDNNLFDEDEVQAVCGMYESNQLSNKGNKGDGKTEKLKTWPWIVSIGKRRKDGSINFRCLGSLITKEFIVSTAQCLQRNPNVILIGESYLGFMSSEDLLPLNEKVEEISEIDFHEKYKSPQSYQNIGIIKLKNSVYVTSQSMPVCFPFLAGVLDIIPFNDIKATTLSFDTSSQDKTKIEFGFEEYKILNATVCTRIFRTSTNKNAETQKRLPHGIKSDLMCGFIQKPSSLCQAPGGPLVIFDQASNSHVIIGLSTGDPTCSEMNRQVVTFTRINAFSSWVRERVGKLPDPPPCYVN